MGQRRKKTAWTPVAVALAAALGIGGAVVAVRSDDEPRPGAVVDVYKSRTCGCCSKWVEHLRDHGFTVRTTDTEELASIKASHGIPGELQSCHTALVGRYVVEGHVPARDVRRLLQERPAITGIAVGGMPIGSPGMEMAGRSDPYYVMSFDRSGTTGVFASYR